MVKKLFKHEILAYFRMLMPVYIILCLTATMSRILQFFEESAISGIYETVFGSTIIIYFISVAAALMLPTIFIIVRFYKNMYSAEGYLTHTLPVTVDAHILIKLATAVLYQIFTLIAILISAVILTLGKPLIYITEKIAYLYSVFAEPLSFHAIYYVIEVVFLILVLSIVNILLFYAIISIGQLSRKNRVVASIGAYFVYYVITQIVGTVFVIVISALSEIIFTSKIMFFVSKNPFETVHIAIIGISVFYALLGVVYYFITRFIVRKKLNLE